MLRVGAIVVGLLSWLLVTGMSNIVLYAFTVGGVAPDWMIAAGIAGNLFLGMSGHAMVCWLIEEINEYRLEKAFEKEEVNE